MAKREIYPELPVLVLDDDEALCVTVRLTLAKGGITNVTTSGDSAEASALILEKGVSLVFLDLYLPEENGEELLKEMARVAPHVPVIIITGTDDAQTIVRCMRAGAVDYLVKPIDETRLLVSAWNALASFELRREAEGFRRRIFDGGLEHPEVFEKITTVDPSMIAVFKYIESIARSRQPVLITGETGTGKELIARAVHEASGRSGRFVAVNVGGLDDTMFSDSLFGHRKGAFTGADSARNGLVKEAEGGTLLLDEVGDLEPHSQVKLLRLLQEGEYYPLGADAPLRSDARIVAATTRDLSASVEIGAFRSDLYYRLQTHPIRLPPLRARSCDILPLVRRFIAESRAELGFDESLSDDRSAQIITDALAGYIFPGNVRELESLVHDAVAGSHGQEPNIDLIRARIGRAADAEPKRLEGAAQPAPCPGSLARIFESGRVPTLAEAERELITLALEKAEGNMSRAAAMLGISRQTLYKKMKDSKAA
jgi:DNA-binding NtrC family response regulator